LNSLLEAIAIAGAVLALALGAMRVVSARRNPKQRALARASRDLNRKRHLTLVPPEEK
jgi:hypothetical protein